MLLTEIKLTLKLKYRNGNKNTLQLNRNIKKNLMKSQNPIVKMKIKANS